MHIAIYDTEHFETVSTLVRIFDEGRNRISLLVTEAMAQELRAALGKDSERVSWLVLPAGDTGNAYRIYRFCKKEQCHLLILNTVAYHHLFFALLCRRLSGTKTILTLHQVNGFFRPRFSLSPKKCLQYFGKRSLAAATDEFAVLLSSTAGYIKEEGLTDKPISVFPGGCYRSEEGKSAADGTIRIVIPGSVDLRRRDYGQVEQLIRLLPHNGRFSILILGAARTDDEKGVLQQLKQIASPGLPVGVYTEEFIAQEEYDRQLLACRLILAPLREKFAEGSAIPERYGLTKSSGCFFDGVRSGKPVLVPRYITLPEELNDQCVPYENVQALSVFLTGLDEAALEALCRRAQANARLFSPEPIRKRLNRLFP